MLNPRENPFSNSWEFKLQQQNFATYFSNNFRLPIQATYSRNWFQATYLVVSWIFPKLMDHSMDSEGIANEVTVKPLR